MNFCRELHIFLIFGMDEQLETDNLVEYVLEYSKIKHLSYTCN